MSNKNPVQSPQVIYIETPRLKRRPEKIDSVLQKRMQDFTRARRRKLRQGTQQ